ncbi:SsgA family sporulation/cell division regulator [Streptomyces sp. RB17]|uniref:SsgA family sporulation/cell division regulator n=1 Tax=Streptomyces sp. RB17 TaxID=2585197 RepID=UPI003A4C77D3
MRFVVSPDLSVPLCMGLRYEPGDPYAVRAAFHPLGEGRTVEWVFGRDMLAQGLTGHVGQGDVRMWPTGGPDRGVLSVALSSPAGSALLEITTQDLAAFLEETYSVVRPGSESEQLDLDAELAMLLADS